MTNFSTTTRLLSTIQDNTLKSPKSQPPAIKDEDLIEGLSRLAEDEELFGYLYDHLPHSEKFTNPGYLREKYSKIYYNHFYQSKGIVFEGVPLVIDGEIAIEAGLEVKLEKPRGYRDEQGKQKWIKYERKPGTPKGEGVFLCPLRSEIKDAIAARWGIRVESWEDVLYKYGLPLVITEGVKKAWELLKQGFLAVSLTGCYGGLRKENDTHRLIEGLTHFCHKDRSVVICFDQDDSPKTIAYVRGAVICLAACLQDNGVKDVKVLSWQSSQGKGIDDFIRNGGNIGEVWQNRQNPPLNTKELEKKAQERMALFDDLRLLNSWINPGKKAIDLINKKRAKKTKIRLNQEVWRKWDGENIEGNLIEIASRDQFQGVTKKALEQGFKAIVDTSETGSGKTHTQGELSTFTFSKFLQESVKKAINEDKNKGDTALINNNKSYVPGLHFISQSGSAPIDAINQKYERYPTRDSEKNCYLASSQIAYQGVSNGDVSNASEGNPVCRSCKHFLAKEQRTNNIWCGSTPNLGDEETKGGYISETVSFMSQNHQYIRSTILGFPANRDRQRIQIALIDEITSLLNPRKVEISLEDLSRSYHKIKAILENKLDRIQELESEISDLINQQFELKLTFDELFEKKGRLFDYDAFPDEKELKAIGDDLKLIADTHKEIESELEVKQKALRKLKKLGTIKADENLKIEAIAFLTKVKETLEKLLVSGNKYYGYSLKDLQAEFKTLGDGVNKDAINLLIQAEDKVLSSFQSVLPENPTPSDVQRLITKGFLGDFLLKVFLNDGDIQASFRISQNKLIKYSFNEGLRKLGNFAAILGFDASAFLRKDELLAYLGHIGISSDKVLFIRVIPKIKDNVKITQYLGAKLESKERRENAQNRVKALREYYLQSGKNVAFVDHKKYAESEDLILMSSDPIKGSRGSNTVYNKGVKTLVQFGSPHINFGDIEATSEVLGIATQDYYARRTCDQVIQSIGRLRANLRDGETLEYEMFSDVDLSYLEDFGYPKAIAKSFNLEFPQLGDARSRTAYEVCSILVAAKEHLGKISLGAIAKIMQRSKSSVSEALGGFSRFLKVFGSAIKSFITDPNSSPSDLKKMVGEILENYDDPASLGKILTGKPKELLTLAEMIIKFASLGRDVTEFLASLDSLEDTNILQMELIT